MHSRGRLALAVLTSPTAAFEEILERRLLGTGLVISALAGAISLVGSLVHATGAGPVQFFALGKENPLAWLGLCMLYALVLHRLLRWSGAQVDFVSLLTVMGWSQVTLALAQFAVVVGVTLTRVPSPNESLVNLLGAANLGFYLWYVAAVAVGIQCASRQPLFRGIMSYLVVEAAALIAFSYTFGRARLGPFEGALPSVWDLARMVTGADQTAWLAASVVGLVLGLLEIGSALGWEKGAIVPGAVSLGLAGAVGFAAYEYALVKCDYYGKLAQAQQSYDRGKYEQAAARLKALLPAATDNARIMLDVADVYCLAGKSDPAIDYYEKFNRSIRRAKLGKRESNPLARGYSGIGAAYELAGKHDLAVREFQRAAKLWPEFRDPWVRLAVTYDRTGSYREAIEAGNHAVKKLDSEAIVAWVALAEAFVNTGDMKQAKAAIAMVAGQDDLVAKRIGKKAEDWKDAVDRLTPKDLAFPLEKEPAQPPPKPEAARRPEPRKR